MKEIKRYGEFVSYLDNIKNIEKPFDCPRLRVLSRELKYKSEFYEKGIIFCAARVSPINKNFQCNVDLLSNKKGRLEVICGHDPFRRFKLKIKK